MIGSGLFPDDMAYHESAHVIVSNDGNRSFETPRHFKTTAEQRCRNLPIRLL